MIVESAEERAVSLCRVNEIRSNETSDSPVDNERMNSLCEEFDTWGYI